MESGNSFNFTTNRECSSRLPCGLCLIINQPCPYFWNEQKYEITCCDNKGDGIN